MTIRRSKYGNRKTIAPDGTVFDSKREADRYFELWKLEKAGIITDLQLQVPFTLAPSVRLAGEARLKPALRYKCDFLYLQDGVWVVEDVKNPHLRKEPTFRVKQHLMKSVHGIDILLT